MLDSFVLVLVGEMVEGSEGQAEAVRLQSDRVAEGLIHLGDG
jgi:hypothetical protein